MRKKSTLFDSKISPCCEYCEFGKINNDIRMIFCEKKGIVSPYFNCKKFIYSPLKRIPKRLPKLPNFEKEDFIL